MFVSVFALYVFSSFWAFYMLYVCIQLVFVIMWLEIARLPLLTRT
eukprot:UN02820